MTRRDFFLATGAAGVCCATPRQSAIAVEGYIFQQYAQRQKKPLQAVIPECLKMAREAGFRNIELNTGFFPPEERDRTLSILRSDGLRMPSVYVGGAVHEREAADRTIATAVEIGNLCRPFGCTAVVTNPDPKPHDAPKTDAELAVEADSLSRMGRTLAQHGFQLRVHHHTPQLVDNAREWRYILQHTDPQYVFICVDVDWAYEGGFEPIPFLQQVGKRLRELHVRSAKNKVWLEDVENSDIDYRKVAEYLKQQDLKPLIVVELAYRPNTVVTRSLEEDLRLSRLYTEKVFGIKPTSS